MRLLLGMFFLMASAAGIHFSGFDLTAGFQGKNASVKKISAVKPKREKIKEPEIPVYTFFETLNDPTMTRYVGLNGKFLPEPAQSTTSPVVPAKISTTPPPVEKIEDSEPAAKPEKKQKKEIRSVPIVEGLPRYAVQVGSFRDEGRAGALKIRLQKKGFDAFLMQTKVTGNTWYRVFLGRYADEKKAQEAALLAKNDYKLNAVVVSKTN